jgi:hypothetical protein
MRDPRLAGAFGRVGCPIQLIERIHIVRAPDFAGLSEERIAETLLGCHASV